jgi:chromosome segregation ATPase
MVRILSTALSGAAESGLQREGLPFWILWLLLCVILLLVTFIFLRDKDLRQRLSLSLYGPRRRWNRITLQARLNRERKKRATLFRDLGRTARSLKHRPKGPSGLFKRLNELDQKLGLSQAEMQKVSSRMEALQAAVKPRRRRGPAAEKAIKLVKRELQKILRDIAGQERHRDSLLEELGMLVKQERTTRREFLPLYAQIDLAEETIDEMQGLIDGLRKK